MDLAELEAVRAKYRRLSDYDIAQLYAQGPSGLRSALYWDLLAAEYGARKAADAQGSLADTERAIRAGIDHRFATEVQREALAVSYTPWWSRIVAAAIDIIVLIIAVSLWGALGRGIGLSQALIEMGAIVGYFVYQVGFEAWIGATLGKRLLGLRVVTPEGARPSVGQLLARAAGRLLLIFGLLWYLIWRTPWGHDVLTRTRVVSVGAA